MAAIFPKWFPSGFRLIDGKALTSWFNNPQSSTEDTITAFATGGQVGAYQLTAAISRISVCATNADSVKLPPSKNCVGQEFLVINDGAANLAVFPEGTATIDGGAPSASVTVTAGRRSILICIAVGLWQSAGMAKST